jgi:HTH-type transcriptional regulator / antitoxin HigA
MNAATARQFISHPGEILRDTIDAHQISQAELALRMDRPTKTINEIINGKAAITPETAQQLALVLGVSATFWLNLELRYRNELATIDAQEQAEEWQAWAKKFPVAHLKKAGYISNDKKNDTPTALLSFFAVASPQAWQTVYGNTVAVNYRIAATQTHQTESIATWLRQGEIACAKMQLPAFDKTTFKANLTAIKALAVAHPDDFKTQLQTLCTLAGVAVVYTPCIAKAPISGAARWIDNTPLIQLSDRYKTNDAFWFTFFHEAGHILLHGKKSIFLEGLTHSEANEIKEQEANRFAEGWLLEAKHYSEIKINLKKSPKYIKEVAAKYNTHPAFIAGRLQHENILHPALANQLKIAVKLFG